MGWRTEVQRPRLSPHQHLKPESPEIPASREHLGGGEGVPLPAWACPLQQAWAALGRAEVVLSSENQR